MTLFQLMMCVHYAMDFLKANYPKRLLERYEIPLDMYDYVEMLDHIGSKRGHYLKVMKSIMIVSIIRS